MESVTLFTDADFPAQDQSLFCDYTSPIAKFRGEVRWMRPQEICQSPKLFPENRQEGFAKQGILGDCWLLCASTMLLKNQHLMDKVLPAKQPLWGEPGYRGRFGFCFWQFGRWVDIEVDDRLPCLGIKLCFSHCQSPSAFWVALLEKAYAKLHGSYENLWAGQVSDALVDLTGGLAECWSLNGPGRAGEELDETEDESWRKFNLDCLQAVKDTCSLSCSVHSSPKGASEPGQYHALSVLEWTEVRTDCGDEVRLLRVRNPWGRSCWVGAWAQSGDRWKHLEPNCAADLLGRTEEGEFWVEEAEFREEFDEVTVGYPINEQGFIQSIYTGNVLPHSHQIGGSWIKGHSAGGCRNSSSFGSNPKFWLRMSEPGEVLVSLLQHRAWWHARDSKGRADADWPPVGSAVQNSHSQAIGLHIWKVEKNCNLTQTLSKTPVASTRCHAYQRQVTVETHLREGYHLLIPSAFLQGAEASFLLRVFSTVSLTLSALKAPGPPGRGVQDGEWETSCSQGAWVPGVSAGGSRNFPSHRLNPRVPLAVSQWSDEPNVRITLRQHSSAKALQPIGFHVYKVPEGTEDPQISPDQEPQASCVPHCHIPEVSLQCNLAPGAYAVVPSTYLPDCSGQFTLAVSQKMHRKVVRCQENLGRPVQEIAHISVMHS